MGRCWGDAGEMLGRCWGGAGGAVKVDKDEVRLAVVF